MAGSFLCIYSIQSMFINRKIETALQSMLSSHCQGQQLKMQTQLEGAALKLQPGNIELHDADLIGAS